MTEYEAIKYAEIHELSEAAKVVLSKRTGGNYSVDDLRIARKTLMDRFQITENPLMFVAKDPSGANIFLGLVLSPITDGQTTDTGDVVNLTYRADTPEVADISFPRNFGGAQTPEYL
jgi:hypothetical protein